MNRLIALAFWIFAIWLIRADTRKRPGISAALWIPTLWVGILASRPITMWLGFGGGADTMEGSPLDRLLYIVLIFAAFYVLARRELDWSMVISDSWPVFLFYGYLLVSVLWAESPFVSFKRWFKDFGNIVVALVILTEVDWQQAFRAVFVRCAYVLIPLSVIFIRYFPEMGRRYSMHSGEMEATGVTTQKNSLGAMVLVCGLILIWDWFERSRPEAERQGKFDRVLPAIMLLIGAYLLYICDSKTSIACLLLGAGVLASTRLPYLRQRISAYGGIALAIVLGLYVIDSAFGIQEWIVRSMGRDMTFTGRTDVWKALLDLKTDPALGEGFCSFWSNQHFQSKLPDWLADGRSAHNGYLELFIDGGYAALAFLAVMMIAIGARINRQLAGSGDYAVVRFAVFVIMLIANVSESHFGRMSPLGFLFLLVALGEIQPQVAPPDENYVEVLPADEPASHREADAEVVSP